jgi:hypothetical protein
MEKGKVNPVSIYNNDIYCSLESKYTVQYYSIYCIQNLLRHSPHFEEVYVGYGQYIHISGTIKISKIQYADYFRYGIGCRDREGQNVLLKTVFYLNIINKVSLLTLVFMRFTIPRKIQ